MLTELLVAFLVHIYRDWSLAFVTTGMAAITYHIIRREHGETIRETLTRTLENTFKYARILFVVAVLVVTPLRYVLVEKRPGSLLVFMAVGVAVAFICLWRSPQDS